MNDFKEEDTNEPQSLEELRQIINKTIFAKQIVVPITVEGDRVYFSFIVPSNNVQGRFQVTLPTS
jgi:hypothetical protein